MASSIVVGTLRAILTADTAQYEQGMRKAAGATKDGTSTITSALSTIGKLTAGAFSVTAVVAFGREMANFASHMQDLASETGIGVEQLQALNYVGAGAGLSIDQLTGSVTQLMNRLGEGDKSAVGALSRLNLQFGQLRQLSPDEMFVQIIQAAAAIDDPIERTRTLMDLFGKMGARMGRLATDDFAQLVAAAKGTGAVLSKDLIDKAARFDDAWTQAVISVKARLVQLGADLAGQERPGMEGMSTQERAAKVFADQMNAMLPAAPALKSMADSMHAIVPSEAAVSALEQSSKQILANAVAAEKAAKAMAAWGQAHARNVSEVNNAVGMLFMERDALEMARQQMVAFEQTMSGMTFDGILVPLDILQAELQQLESSTIPGFTVAIKEATIQPPKLAGSFESMIRGMQSSLKSLMDGMTGKNGLSGFFENLGRDLVQGFGNILSGGITAAVNLGVQLALKGIQKIGSLLAGLFKSEESKHVNKPRDQFFEQYGGYEGLATKLNQATNDAGMTDSLIRALYAADTVAKFKAAQQAIVALIGGNVFRQGTPGLGFTDFGLGQLAAVHGREAIVPEHRKAEAIERWSGGINQASIDDLRSEVARLRSDFRWMIDGLPSAIRNAVLARA